MDREQIIEQSHVNEVYSRQTYQQVKILLMSFKSSQRVDILLEQIIINR